MEQTMLRNNIAGVDQPIKSLMDIDVQCLAGHIDMHNLLTSLDTTHGASLY